MQKNIYANLDLIKSLSEFQEQVTKSLEANDISEWDGRTFKEREEAIRQSALVLAGQCIAILLYKLSQSKLADQTAINQTKGWWHPKTQKHGYRKRQILTIGNVAVNLRLPYVVEKTKTTLEKKKTTVQGFYPFLQWLGMSEGLTPLLWSTIAKYGASSSSYSGAQTILKDWGITMSTKRIERLTYEFGQIGINLRQAKIAQLRQGNLPEGKILKDQKVVISVDGGRSRIRVNKPGRKNSKTNRHGFIGEWVEPKLLTIYVVDEQGKKVKTDEMTVINDGTYEDYKGFLTILEMHLVSLGISQAKEVLLVADGAEWIWKHIPTLLKKLNSPTATYELLDFYHVAERLQKFADVAFSDEQEKQNWFKQARKTLKKSHSLNLIRQMDEFIAQAAGERCQTMITQRNYLLRAYRARRLNYAQVAAKNLPIGSGAIESLIRQVVNLRIKGNGKFWLKAHAEIILHLRCQWMAKNWHNFCDCVFTSFINPQVAI